MMNYTQALATDSIRKRQARAAIAETKYLKAIHAFAPTVTPLQRQLCNYWR